MTYRSKIFKKLFGMGFRLIPTHGIFNGHCTCHEGVNCTKAGKHPLWAKWQEKIITSEEQIDEILKSYPYANFAIVTGNGLVVIDVDTKEGHDGAKSFQKIKNFITPTMTVRTGSGGYHYYYRVNEPVRNRTSFLPGIDVRGDGGFVVAPGSIHLCGGEYKIVEFEKVKENKNV